MVVFHSQLAFYLHIVVAVVSLAIILFLDEERRLPWMNLRVRVAIQIVLAIVFVWTAVMAIGSFVPKEQIRGRNVPNSTAPEG